MLEGLRGRASADLPALVSSALFALRPPGAFSTRPCSKRRRAGAGAFPRGDRARGSRAAEIDRAIKGVIARRPVGRLHDPWAKLVPWNRCLRRSRCCALGKRARAASRELARRYRVKNPALLAMAAQIRAQSKAILQANAADVANKGAGNDDAFVDRLTLDAGLVEQM